MFNAIRRQISSVVVPTTRGVAIGSKYTLPSSGFEVTSTDLSLSAQNLLRSYAQAKNSTNRGNRIFPLLFPPRQRGEGKKNSSKALVKFQSIRQTGLEGVVVVLCLLASLVLFGWRFCRKVPASAFMGQWVGGY